VVAVAVEPEAQKIAGFWRQRQGYCDSGGFLGGGGRCSAAAAAGGF
jgi:hypothetical protein